MRGAAQGRGTHPRGAQGRGAGHRTPWGWPNTGGSQGHSPGQTPTSEEPAQAPCGLQGPGGPGTGLGPRTLGSSDAWGSTRDTGVRRSSEACSALQREPGRGSVSGGVRELFLAPLGPLGPLAVVTWPPGGHPGLSDCLWGAMPSLSPPETGPSPSARRAPRTPPHPHCSPPRVPGRPSPRSCQEARRRRRTLPQVRIRGGKWCEGSRGGDAGITGPRSPWAGAELPPDLSCPRFASCREAGLQDVSSGQNLPGCQPTRATRRRHGEGQGPRSHPSPARPTCCMSVL